MWLYFVSYLSDHVDSKALIRILIWIQGGSEFEATRRGGEDTDRADSQDIAVVEECVPMHLLTLKNLCQVHPCFSVL